MYKITILCWMLHYIALQWNIPFFPDDVYNEEVLGDVEELPNKYDSGEEVNYLHQDVIDSFISWG